MVIALKLLRTLLPKLARMCIRICICICIYSTPTPRVYLLHKSHIYITECMHDASSFFIFYWLFLVILRVVTVVLFNHEYKFVVYLYSKKKNKLKLLPLMNCFLFALNIYNCEISRCKFRCQNKTYQCIRCKY